ncbi:M56 family metallopeptidase [Halostreptopolyspora alba]|uniref:M56 family peptidase n=1 Tax=Halostreptopolyspora alba TaxID=2487137 RepID=A0A3N0EDR7_9ACTN|nr:M56 family peptidase [Nocardiopsaceae bacterium YIM 96095]
MRTPGNRAFWGVLAASLAGTALTLVGLCCILVVAKAAARVEEPSHLVPFAPAAALVVFAALGMAIGVLYGVRETWRLRRLGGELRARRVATPPRLETLAGELGLAGRIESVRAHEPFALTYGLRRPRVAVSTGLLEAMSRDELRAVLVHERSHVLSRDPLKILLMRVLLAREFHLPVLAYLRTRFTAARELAADEAATAACGRKPLAGALLKTLSGPRWAQAPAAASLGGGMIDARIRQLEDGQAPKLAGPSPVLLMLTLLGGSLVTWSVVGSAHLVIQHCAMM